MLKFDIEVDIITRLTVTGLEAESEEDVREIIESAYDSGYLSEDYFRYVDTKVPDDLSQDDEGYEIYSIHGEDIDDE